MPNLTKENIVDACCEAIKIWEFGDNNVPTPHGRTDKQLITYFGGKWMDRYANNLRATLSEEELTALIYTCGIEKILTVRQNRPKLEECGKYLNKGKFGKFVTVSLNHRNPARWDYGNKFIKELATNLSAAGGEHNALASRFLFFAVPQAFVFNYSKPLIDVLKERVRLTDKTVATVGGEMSKLFEEHHKYLHLLPRPKFPSKLSKAIKFGSWWERRVLDLAVLNYWK